MKQHCKVLYEGEREKRRGRPKKEWLEAVKKVRRVEEKTRRNSKGSEKTETDCQDYETKGLLL